MEDSFISKNVQMDFIQTKKAYPFAQHAQSGLFATKRSIKIRFLALRARNAISALKDNLSALPAHMNILKEASNNAPYARTLTTVERVNKLISASRVTSARQV